MALTRIKSSDVVVTPTGNVAATNAQSAIAEIDSEKQVSLVSGTNIKTVGGVSILGSGDIAAGSGSGGQVITGNVTLSSSSGAAISVTPSSHGLYATLPDATTCSKSDNTFAIYNAGDYDYGVKDSTGTQLGWVRPRTGSLIGLADNSTAAGVWSPYGLEKTGITASLSNTSATGMAGNIRRIAIDANRTCFLFGGTDCYGVVYDASTQTWGAASLVRTGTASGAFNGVLSTTNQVLVCSCDTTTGFQAVTLTIATNTITINTPVSTVLSSNFQAPSLKMPLIAVGTSFVVAYWVTAGEARALTISGTVPTIGSASTLPATYVGSTITLYAASSIVRVLQTDNTNIYLKPFTVSTSTLSAGTQATTASTIFNSRSFLNGNGNIVVQYVNTTMFGAVFKLTGTVEAVSTVSLGATAPSTLSTSTDLAVISASKTAFGWSAASANMYCNILTDTSGTASAGTAITTVVAASIPNITAVNATGNTVRFTAFSANAGQNQFQFGYDCSGTSPTLTYAQRYNTNSSQTGGGCFTPETLVTPTSSDVYGVRSFSSLINGTSFYGLTGGNISVNDVQILPSGIYQRNSQYIINSSGVTGVNTNESWFMGVLGTPGVNINRVECAA